jgi:nitroreductase
VKKPADTSVSINELLTHRWSPRSFDSQFEVSQEDIVALLEAGRWAPSGNNSQPWRFIVARQGDDNFTTINSTLTGFNQVWAPTSSLYIAIAAKMVTPDGAARPVSLYDSGLAAAMITIEAVYRGLAVHHIGGFDHEAFSTAFSLDADVKPVIILAIGKQAPVDALSDDTLKEREVAPRERKPLEEIVISGLHK